MKNIIMIVLVGFILIIGAYNVLFVSNESESILVVKNFLVALKAENYNELEKFVINPPHSYNESLTLALREMQDREEQVINDSNQNSSLNNGNELGSIVKSNYNFTNKEIVSQLLRYLDKSRNYSKIISSKELGSEAKIVIAMKKDGLQDSLYSFLLYNEKGEWKIFNISNFDKANFDLDKYWAEKRN